MRRADGQGPRQAAAKPGLRGKWCERGDSNPHDLGSVDFEGRQIAYPISIRPTAMAR
jgi:hypothetical protein